jgi:heme/copper-type cytochrome/quinol oxidase subunit 3
MLAPAAESAIFTIFVVAYLFYVGKSLSGPTPQAVLKLPILNSVCLISSSLTIMFALRALSKGGRGEALSCFGGQPLSPSAAISFSAPVSSGDV